MRKINLFHAKNILAAGMLSVLVISSVSTALAAEKKATVQQAAATVVDAEAAQEIAFADADITSDQAERLKTKTERENGETVFEVTFTVNGVKYEYLIRKEDGTILEWEIDGRDIGDAVAEESLKNDSKESGNSESEASENTKTLVGLERAKEIALLDAGLKAADVSFSKIKFEKDSREVVYEIEFYQNREEFEYTIDAYSGEILKMERD